MQQIEPYKAAMELNPF